MKRISACAAAALTLAVLTGFMAGCGTNPVYERPKPPSMTGNFYYPLGIVYLDDALYISDSNNNTIRKVNLLLTLDANISTVAGTAGMPGALNGTGADARFYSPAYLTTDNTNIFVAGGLDRAVRKIDPAAVVSTYAGKLGVRGTTDGDNIDTALFTMPQGITMLGTDFYVLDALGTSASIRFIDSTNNVTATKTLDQPTLFNRPYGITECGGNLYVANMGDATILKITLGDPMNVTIFAGQSGVKGSTDGDGLTQALFESPTGITCVADTDLYITDTGNSTIRRTVLVSGNVTTVAGSAGITGDDNGTGASALFKYPFGITASTDGLALYVTDTHNHTIRKIDIDINYGEVTTIAGTPGEPGSIDTVVP